MRLVSQGAGVGTLITALVVGSPWWFLLVLTGAVLLLGVMTLTADQIDAFNRLFRGPSTGDVSKRQDPRARDVENSQPQKLVEQRNQKELPPPSDGTTSPKKDKRKKGSRRHD